MGNGTKRVPAEVQTAIDLAKQADWDVSIRNGKMVISAPDGVAITIGMNPNDESMKVFRSNARKYNLVGDGPARTPAESEALLAQVEADTAKKAQAANAQRKAFEAAQAKKRAEAEAARQKAEEATQGGLMDSDAPAEEISQETPVPLPTDIPVFDPALMGQTQSDLFLVSLNGVETYYCIECWSQAKKFTSKRPQGLAMHRGFRHGIYGGHAVPSSAPETQETSSVQNHALPSDVNDALELLVSVLGENFAGSGSSAEIEDLKKQISGLEAKIAQVSSEAERDLLLSDKQYTEAKAAFDKASEATKKKIHDLSKELSGKEAAHAAETEQLMKSFKMLLSKILEAVNTQAPVKAVGIIDELIKPYMG